MTAIHSAWLLNNTHAAVEAAEAAGETFPASHLALTAVIAHTAFRTGRVTLTQPSMAEAINAGERSIGPMVDRLARIGILERRSPGHYRLGKFWQAMEAEERAFRFQPEDPAERQPKPKVAQWVRDFFAYTTPDDAELARIREATGTDATPEALTEWGKAEADPYSRLAHIIQ